jgi:hypothetical protein
MAGERSNLEDDYFALTKRCGRPKNRWTWEIRRRSKPSNIKYDADDFATAQEARFAGVKALKELKELLDRLTQEMK